jgi:hypothetical protein
MLCRFMFNMKQLENIHFILIGKYGRNTKHQPQRYALMQRKVQSNLFVVIFCL